MSLSLRRFDDTPDGVCPREAQSWNDILDRHPKLAAIVADDPPTRREVAWWPDLDLSEMESDARLDAGDRVVLGLMRSMGRVVPITEPELAARLWPDALPQDVRDVAETCQRLVSRRMVARRAGGGFVILWRAP